MLNKLLKGTDVAQILGISKALAYRLMAQGQISSVRFGRTVRVRLEDLEIFIQRNMTKSLVQSENGNVVISNLRLLGKDSGLGGSHEQTR
jgi:excisionase family DNA binding protein